MKDHTGCIRGFHWFNRAWYAPSLTDESISFGMYEPNCGTSGEMMMVWHKLSGGKVPRLECFDDGWNALSLFTDLIQKLGEHDDKNISQEQFVKILLDCGFADMTAYRREP
jgi:hypothetical protein